MTAPLVVKLGGTCFLDLDDYATVAGWLAGRLAPDGKGVVVVSAMSGTTGALDAALRRLHPDPPPRVAADVLLHGDASSAAFLAAALSARGVPAEVAAGHRTGVVAAGRPDRARVARVDPAPLRAALAGTRVAVVPGGQGIDPAGRPVMLGRNSSDVSAVVAAVAVGASECEILSDLPGVFTADPHLVPEARPIPALGYGAARVMAESGAKVLHPAAVALAERHDVTVRCRAWPPGPGTGTVVARGGGVDAVVAAPRSRVWACPAGTVRPPVDDDGDAPLVVGAAGTLHLVWPLGDEGPVPPGAVARPDVRLLTVLRDGADPERLLVPATTLAADAQRWHRELLGEPAFGWAPVTPLAAKRRSAHSGLLAGGRLPGPD